MAEGFANHWMRSVIAASRAGAPWPQAVDNPIDELLRETLFSIRPEEFTDLLSSIRDFPGFKVLLSCTDRTALEDAVKQAFCFADLIIVVPAPLWVSCASTGSDHYAEFNYDSIGRGGCWGAQVGVLQNVSRLLGASMEAIDPGSITFLPMLDESLYPWSPLDLSLSPLPRPYSDSPRTYTEADVQLEAFYGLCRERLIAEYLGAVHLNVLSFSQPVLGDFSVGKPLAQEPWRRSLTEIVLPDVTGLSISNLLDFRRKAAASCRQFSALVADLLKPQRADPKEKELVRSSIASFSRQMELTLRNNALAQEPIAQTSFVLGSGGRNGGVMPAVDYLVGGRQLSGLVRLLINANGEPRLKIQGTSMLTDVLT